MVYKELLKTNKPLSILYFTDHEQTYFTDAKQFQHSSTKEGVHIPSFVVIEKNNDATPSHTVMEKTITGYHLIDLFANWVDIQTNFTNSNYTLTKYPDIEEKDKIIINAETKSNAKLEDLKNLFNTNI